MTRFKPGDRAIVTGDTAEWLHGLKDGDVVTVTDTGKDGYMVRGIAELDDHLPWAVAEVDLRPELGQFDPTGGRWAAVSDVSPAAINAAAEALDRHFSDWHYTGEAHDGLSCAAQDALAAALPRIAAQVLREAADEAEAVIADGNMAEVAAPVSGERGRGAVITARDALYEEPGEWLRARADRLDRGAVEVER